MAALLYRGDATYNSLMTISGTQSRFLGIVIHEEPHSSGSHLTNSFLHFCNANQTVQYISTWLHNSIKLQLSGNTVSSGNIIVL